MFMRHLSIIGFLSILGLSYAAPVPREEAKIVLYHPVRKGDTWVYEMTVGKNQSEEETIVVTNVDEKDGCKIVTVEEQINGKKRIPWIMSVSEKGLYKLVHNDEKLDPPACVLTIPAKLGDQWKVGESMATVRAIEKVKVPAGDYAAIRVDWNFLDRNGLSKTIKYWYAPEVCTVRVETEECVTVLKSFTPAK